MPRITNMLSGRISSPAVVLMLFAFVLYYNMLLRDLNVRGGVLGYKNQYLTETVIQSLVQLPPATVFYWDLLFSSRVAPVVKNPPANPGDIRDTGSILTLERSPGREHGKPLQYSCLENPMERGAGQPPLQSMGSQKSQTWLRWLSTTMIILCTSISYLLNSYEVLSADWRWAVDLFSTHPFLHLSLSPFSWYLLSMYDAPDARRGAGNITMVRIWFCLQDAHSWGRHRQGVHQPQGLNGSMPL